MPKLVGKGVFRLILAHTLVLKCRCARHIFKSYRKCVAMVMAHYSKNWRKQSISNESWHRCWPRSVNEYTNLVFTSLPSLPHILYSNAPGAGVLITFSDISSFMCSPLKRFPWIFIKLRSKKSSFPLSKAWAAERSGRKMKLEGHPLFINIVHKQWVPLKLHCPTQAFTAHGVKELDGVKVRNTNFQFQKHNVCMHVCVLELVCS